MLKTINLNSTVENLPPKITYHYVDDKYLVIAPDMANYLVLDAIEFDIFNVLRMGHTFYNALCAIMNKYTLSSDESVRHLARLMNHLELQNFYSHVPVVQIEKFDTLHVHLTNLCNFTCKHCYMSSGKKLDNELQTHEWKKLMVEASDYLQDKKITFSGGEPLLHLDAIELIRFAKEQGYSTAIVTNGSRLNTLEFAKEIIPYIDGVKISLDGASEEVNNSIRGAKAFNKAIKSMHILKELDKPFIITITVMQNNAEDLIHNIVDLYKRINYDKFMFEFSTLQRLGRANEQISGYLDDNESLRIIGQLNKLLEYEGYVNSQSIEVNAFSNNCLFGKYIVITANGNVYPCNSFNTCYGNIRETPISTILSTINELQELSNVDNSPVCQQCDVKYICKGGCKVINYNQNGIFSRVSCSDSFKEAFYRRLMHMYDYVPINMT